MRRARDTGESSLELLLDTICNTFGGVLFVALLVAVLLQLSHSKLSASMDSENANISLLQLQQQAEDARAELRRLRRVQTLQQEMLRDLVPEDYQDELERLFSLRRQQAELEEQLAELRDKSINAQVQINKIASEIERLDAAIEESIERTHELEKQLEVAIKENTQTVDLPRARATTKTEIAVAIRYGRLYFVHRYRDSADDRTPNWQDFVLISEGVDDFHLTPKPYAGIEIEETERFRRALLERLKPLPSREVYIACAVWEDSFEEFGVLREFIVDSGYEYRLIPVEQGDGIKEGYVEDVHVQ